MLEKQVPESNILCPFCKQPVPAGASKCYHCGEQLTVTSPVKKTTRKVMGLIGIITALLSLFFGLKEGYYFVKERQEQRAMASSYLSAAEHFLELDSLTYAEDSLNRALALSPNDQQLRARVFQLRAGHLLREADFYGLQLPEEKLTVIPELLINGFSLLNSDWPAERRADLLLYLARLLQHDQQWQSRAGINKLFSEAYQLVPGNAEVAYWFGAWLLQAEATKDRGYTLIAKAVNAAPANALYTLSLGRAEKERGDYQSAFSAFMRAIDSRPEQHELHNIRAANEAKSQLARALLAAHEVSPITGVEFFGITLQERVAITRYTLQQTNNRQLQLLGAELFLHAKHFMEAENWIRKAIGNYNSRTDPEQLMLLASILGANKNTREQQEVLDILATIQEQAGYEEILETGFQDQHRYKIGLKLARETEKEGALVVTAYELYPFHKAGVRPGDRLLELGHRKISSMRSISQIILSLSPGTEIPLKLSRNDEVLVLTVVIE